MCLKTSLLKQMKWDAFSLTEDMEYGLRLLASGTRVDFVPDAKVWAEAPARLEAARSQHLRWEAGRFRLARRLFLRLLLSAVRKRNLAFLDAAVELTMPPLAALLLAQMALTAIAAFVPSLRHLLWIPVLGLAAETTHVFAGLVLSKARFRVWVSLLWAPVYVIWQTFVYVAAMVQGKRLPWTRTQRQAEKRD
jgi:cellulose synthase/poly-beta-1,6-N-acetylglucosamine synthase-like glycosyltransferase